MLRHYLARCDMCSGLASTIQYSAVSPQVTDTRELRGGNMSSSSHYYTCDLATNILLPIPTTSGSDSLEVSGSKGKCSHQETQQRVSEVESLDSHLAIWGSLQQWTNRQQGEFHVEWMIDSIMGFQSESLDPIQTWLGGIGLLSCK